MSDTDTEFDYRPNLELRGYAGTDVQLLQRLKARGRNRREAEANARTIQYNYAIKDSVVRFNNELELAPRAKFRAQELDMDLLIPFEKPFRMTRDFAYFIRNRFSDKELDRMDRTIWKLTANDGLVSVNFPRDYKDESEEDNNDNEGQDIDLSTDADDDDFNTDFSSAGPATRTFTVDSFDEIDVTGAMIVRIEPGDVFKVVADGEKKDIDRLDVDVDGRTLKLAPTKNGPFGVFNNRNVRFTITMPKVEGLKLTGASRAQLSGFTPFNRLDVELTGASTALIDVSVDRLDVDLNGASKVLLKGKADELKGSMTGASLINAKGMTVNKADMRASGASRGIMGQVNDLKKNTSGAGRITSTGDSE
ncbi:MAG: head GIN domain-containing protein [Gemmataceae bacterium]